MTKQSREVLRMELQISELIRIVANLNDRLKYLEDIEAGRMHFNLHRPPDDHRIGAVQKA